MSNGRPEDWERAYNVAVTGRTLEAARFLARWVLDTRPSDPLPFSVIAACDHLFVWQSEVRSESQKEPPDGTLTAHDRAG